MSNASQGAGGGLSGKAIAGIVGIIGVGILMTIGLMNAADSDSDDSEQAADVALIAESDRVTLPDFEGELGDGTTFTSEEIDGPTVIHVYASWCTVCRGEAAAVGEVMDERGDDVDFLMVAVDDDPEASLQFANDYEWAGAGDGLPIINDSDRSIETTKLGLPGGQPHFLIVNDDGEVAWVRQGGTSKPELLGAIDKVVDESA